MIEKQSLENLINTLKPIAMGGTLEIAEIEGDTVKIKFNCPDIGIFKVQGKIVNASDEIKLKIETQIKKVFSQAKIIFI